MEKKFWTAVGVSLAAYVVYLVLPFVSVLIYGLFIYYISRPVYRRIKARIKNGFFSAFTSIFLIVLPVVVLILYTSIIASTELSEVLVESRIDARGRVTQMVSGASDLAGDIEPVDIITLIQDNTNIGQYLFSVGLLALNLVFKLILALIAGFLFLRDEGRFRRWFMRSFLSKDAKVADTFFSDVDNALQHVFSGSILTAGITAMLGAITFTTLNFIAPHPSLQIPYPLLLALLCGLANLIPAVGIKLVWIPLVGYLAFQAAAANVLLAELWFMILFLVVVNLIVDSFPEFIIRPYTTGGLVEPGVMLFAYIFGPFVFGLSGLFIGPMIVITSAAFVKNVLPYLRKK